MLTIFNPIPVLSKVKIDKSWIFSRKICDKNKILLVKFGNVEPTSLED